MFDIFYISNHVMDSVRFHWIPNGSMGFYRIPGFQDSVLSSLDEYHSEVDKPDHANVAKSTNKGEW